MPYLKGNNPEASKIHKEYEMEHNQQSFLSAARQFLERERATSNTNGAESRNSSQPPATTPPPVANGNSGENEVAKPPPVQTQPASAAPPAPSDRPLSSAQNISMPQAQSFAGQRPLDRQTLFQQGQPPPAAVTNNSTNTQAPLSQVPPNIASDTLDQPREDSVSSLLRMSTLERGLDDLMNDDPIVPTPGLSSIWGAHSAAAAPSTTAAAPPERSAGTPPRSAVNGMLHQPGTTTNSTTTSAAASPARTPPSPWMYGSGPMANNANGTPVGTPAPSVNSTPAGSPPKLDEATSILNNLPATVTKDGANALPSTQKTVKKEPIPPKRVWTHSDEQPGKILVNGCSGDDSSIVLSFAPREELTAHWALSLAYLRDRAELKHGPNVSIEKVLSSLTLGLFRRGCTENGLQASIVSKGVLGDFWKDPASGSVRGKVPFYSPRTPGHVIFRLYWEDDPLYTLAMGPGILVRVLEPDFENSVRFILSNFKGKKSNPTSLSSLHSLSTVLETKITRSNESAARATWGCIQEARKVLEACAGEYDKTTAKLAVLEESVEDLKKQVEAEETKSQDLDASVLSQEDDENSQSEAAASLKEKTRSLMSGRASCERKWRDSQLAFASILKAVVSNTSMQGLLRRDLITKMRIEYELWCPLSEEFALLADDVRMWYEPLRELPQSITAEDFRRYSQARVKMQMRTLGFEPNTSTLEDVLFPRNRGAPNQRSMDPGAVSVFNNMSGAMGKFFQSMYAGEDVVARRRELIRQQTEKCVQECGVFPPGTRVAIFGSSANGFGSPKSDLDMCLQIPEGTSLGEGDSSGSESMAKLASYFESAGMTEVDTVRLTARIPIIMYLCPNPLAEGEDDPEFIECDLSMHNPLAVLNTALLRTYAEITPVTRVLASIIKRWAKARDINNPARHTLSSYGYIIMMIHFLTYHKRTGNGLVSPAAPPEGDHLHRNPTAPRALPLLPNLQWMDPMWPNLPRGTPYRELPSLPRRMISHPIEKEKKVNAHFFKPNTPNETAVLQMLFPGQDLSLAILLASFFRYFAFEFDYKRYVVSLHSTSARGLVEREVKAELDGWRNYSAALTIEDPFETFYDVAHVLRGGYYHRIRREFAVAYTKIADAASGRQGSWNKGDLRALSGEDLIDWICEPVERERAESIS